MRAVRMLAACGAALLAASAIAGVPAKFEQVPPKEFRPLDLALRLDSGVAAKRDHETFDLAAGLTLARCPTGVWSGRATFTGHAGGTVAWEGRLWRCFPFGNGTAIYPNGTRHTGTVNSYLLSPAAPALLQGAAADGFRLDAASVRLAVREGKGSFTRADGSVLQADFLRGEPLDPKDVEDEQALRLKAFGAALVTLDLQLRQAELAVQRELAAAKAAEDKRIAEEKRKAEEARLTAERAEAERVAAAEARVIAMQAELAAVRGGLAGAKAAGPAAKAAARGPTDPAACRADDALLNDYMVAQNAFASRNGWNASTFEDVRKRYEESLRYMQGSSPESLRAMVQRDEDYWAKAGVSGHAIGLVQISGEQARMSYAEHRILTQLRLCVAEATERKAAGADAARREAEQRQAQTLAGLAASAADPAAKACVDAYASQEKYFGAINSRRPADVALIPELQTVMFMLEARLAMLDKVCRGHALYGERGSVQAALAQAVETCKGFAVSADLCHADIAW